jgi:hypothetical protein
VGWWISVMLIRHGHRGGSSHATRSFTHRNRVARAETK